MTKPSGPHPVYLLAGGGPERRADDSALLARILRESRSASPTVAYVGAANGDNLGFFKTIRGLFVDAGAGDVRLARLADPGASRDDALRVLNDADLIFISGGDVEEGMRVLAKRDTVAELTRLHRTGTPFCGLSAGSIMLAKAWVRWRDPDDDAAAEMFPCLGFASVLCDTHAEEDDWMELRALLKLLPTGTIGYGIPAGSAIKVMPNGAVRALGERVHRLVAGKS